MMLSRTHKIILGAVVMLVIASGIVAVFMFKKPSNEPDGGAPNQPPEGQQPVGSATDDEVGEPVAPLPQDAPNPLELVEVDDVRIGVEMEMSLAEKERWGYSSSAVVRYIWVYPDGDTSAAPVRIITSAPEPEPIDTDGDGLANVEERARGTDPAKTDTDGDGSDDNTEVRQKRDPLDPAN